MSASQTTERTRKLSLKVESLPAGRSRIVLEDGGALEHTDQLNLSSERQRLRIAQACDAKCPGCLDEVLALLEKEALRQRVKFDPAEDDLCRFVFTSADKVLSEPVDWLWERYIPAGAVTILEGDPGVGKSLLLADLAARTSRGFLAPDRNPAFDEPGHDPEPYPELVWWFSGQDHYERTLAPRLHAAGANMSMIKFIEGTEDIKSSKCRAVSFPDDFVSLWKAKGAAPRLVVVDPLTSFCGPNFHQATARKVLTELARFAASTGAAVVVVRPLNRRLGVSAAERGSAGPSLTAESRSALLLAPHPDDQEKQILAVVKSNLCARAPSLELTIQSAPLPNSIACSPDPLFRSPAPTPILSWRGPSPLAADDLVRVRPNTAPSRSPFESKKVEEWLTEKLSSGPRLASEITDQAALDSVPPSLLRRARISLNIIPSGSNGSTTWTLPKFPSPVAGEGLGVRGTAQHSAHESPNGGTGSAAEAVREITDHHCVCTSADRQPPSSSPAHPWPQTPGPNSDLRLPTSDLRSPTSDFRPPTPDFSPHPLVDPSLPLHLHDPLKAIEDLLADPPSFNPA